MGQTELIMKYLRENPLKNVTPLKMMTAYHQVIDSYLVHQQEHWGILLLLPADAYSFDQRIYPNAERIVLMDYSSPEVLPELLKRLPGETNLVFKIQEQTRISIAGQFPLHKVRCFYSYSSTVEQRFDPDAEAVLNEQMDERLLPLWRANDYSKEEIEHYFADGAFSISIFQGDTPLSTCLVFRNEERIWEIGAVRTAEAGRRSGLAQRVVRTAVFHTLQRGYIPRYQVEDTNIASIRLAESVGLTLTVKLEHWLNYIEQLK